MGPIAREAERRGAPARASARRWLVAGGGGRLRTAVARGGRCGAAVGVTAAPRAVAALRGGEEAGGGALGRRRTPVVEMELDAS
ncbi:hypothetical protein E2562_000071 [Oryza meyeriana var. granulata]|uniref:Uncharacterized protein n=1 Tax=Oryza meyeriana var. granulata TaxID=110450 RepID=A0A6G1DBR9_9ORYZ|nr:hypothetical protein E2562_000071 [Oryza meyeriana var. granulata]